MGNRNIYPGRQWDDRFAICAKELPRHFYSKSEEIPVTGFTTRERLSFEEACRMAGKEATSIKPGTAWGNLWEYGWFLASFTVPGELAGKHLVFFPGVGEEMLVWVDGVVSGAVDLKHSYGMLCRPRPPAGRRGILSGR